MSSRTQRTGFVSEMGFKGPWAKRRSQEHALMKGNGNIWEYGEASRCTMMRQYSCHSEHGFSQGVAAAGTDFRQKYC